MDGLVNRKDRQRLVDVTTRYKGFSGPVGVSGESLCWTLDFNISPMSSLLVQVQTEATTATSVPLPGAGLERRARALRQGASVFAGARVQALGYMMELDRSIRAGEAVRDFLLLPDPGSAIHPAHRFGDQMIAINQMIAIHLGVELRLLAFSSLVLTTFNASISFVALRMSLTSPRLALHGGTSRALIVVSILCLGIRSVNEGLSAHGLRRTCRGPRPKAQASNLDDSMPAAVISRRPLRRRLLSS